MHPNVGRRVTTSPPRLLASPDLVAFRTAWGIHAGVYAGALLGLALAVHRVRKRVESDPPA